MQINPSGADGWIFGKDFGYTIAVVDVLIIHVARSSGSIPR